MYSLRIFWFSVFLFVGSTILSSQGLYDMDAVQEIRIYFKEPNWSELLDSAKMAGEGERMLAQAVLNGKEYEDVGVRFKGNSSYFNVRKTGSSKLPFNIKSDHEHKKQEFYDDYERIKLSNVFRDPSYVREVLSYEIARKYMPAPQANFMKVYVNDEYLGLYTNTESIDEEFLAEYFEEDAGSFFKCDPIWHGEPRPYCPEGEKASLMYLGENPNCYMTYYEMKSKKGWSDLVELTDYLNNKPDSIEQILDVDMALWMLAFNTVLLNYDSYSGRLCHNYYLYQKSNGQFVPLIWDLNLSFGGFRFVGTGKALDQEELQTVSPFLHFKEKNEKRPLITQLFSNPLYRKIYVGHIRTILEENFSNGWYLERGKEWQALIDEEVKKDQNKLYPYEAFKQNLIETTKAGRVDIPGIQSLMEGRIAYLESHPVIKREYPRIDTVEALEFGPTLAIQAKVTGAAERVFLAYRTDPMAAFIRTEMFDDSGHNDEMAGDGLYGITFEEDVEYLEYYIIAEGEASATLSPARASYEFYEYAKGE